MQWFSFAWGVGGKRGAELRGHGLWKTLGLSETHEKTIISLNEFSSSTWEVKVCYFKLQRKSIGVKRVFKSRRRIHHFGRKKKTFKCQRAVQWLSFVCGGYFIFHSDLRRPCFNFLKKLWNPKACFAHYLSPWKATVAVFARLKAGYLKRALTTINK